MNRFSFLAKSGVILALVFLSSSIAFAQNNKTWVSGAGVDAGNCSRTNPCATFAFAVGVTNSNGEIDVLDGGNFGPVTVTKPITIDGTGSVASIQVSMANAMTITLSNLADVVHLKGLQFNGMHEGGVPSPLFNAITFNGTGALVVESCNIENFSNAGIDFSPPTGGELFVRDSTLTNNDFFGIRVQAVTSGNAGVTVDNVRLTNNGKYATGMGLWLGARTTGLIRDSVIAGSGGGAIAAQPLAGTSLLNVETCVIYNNFQGIMAGFGPGAANIRLANTTIVDNTGAGFANTGGSNITSLGNNKVSGNAAGNGPPSITVIQQ